MINFFIGVANLQYKFFYFYFFDLSKREESLF